VDRIAGRLAGAGADVVSDGGFEAFVAARSTALLRTAHLLTNDRARARDLVQLALMAAHRRWDDLPDPTAYARRELVSAHTGWRRRLQVGDLLTESPLLASTAGLPGFSTPRPPEPGPRTEVSAALAQLPPRQRAALVLRHGEDLSEVATADALDTSVEDTRALLRLALDRLGALLPGPSGDDALVERLRADLTARAADVVAAPDETHDAVLDGARAQRHHLAGLVALAAFVVLVVLVVALTI
jgi:DNA-directed RNA polymerase specialized sigma24 family protein